MATTDVLCLDSMSISCICGYYRCTLFGFHVATTDVLCLDSVATTDVLCLDSMWLLQMYFVWIP